MLPLHEKYETLLRNELKTALGCTEPIAVAYAAARAVQVLGHAAEYLQMACSSNVIKNAKAVVVPGTGGMRGIEAAAVAGALAGDADAGLEVLHAMAARDVEAVKNAVGSGFCAVSLMESDIPLHLRCTATGQGQTASVEIGYEHLNVLSITKNGAVVYSGKAEQSGAEDITFLNIRAILDYVTHADLAPLQDVLERQIRLNGDIAAEGLANPYGAQVGRTILDHREDTVRTRAVGAAAAGSDARMAGCELPVVIVSGSGNQGIAASIPVVEYARGMGCSRDALYRAVMFSDLIALYLKSGIGRLSAYCGAVCAACASGAAITYLVGGTYRQIGDTIINMLANVSGMVCDGAKASCAAKIATSLDAAFVAHDMAMKGLSFRGGEGIVKNDIEGTIQNVWQLARQGMHETDNEMMRIVLDS